MIMEGIMWPVALAGVSLLWAAEYGLYAAGIVLSVRRHRAGSPGFSLIAWFFALWLGTSLGKLVIQLVLPRYLLAVAPATPAGFVMGLSQAAINLVRIAALVLLLVGLMRREEKTS
ncbi:MAG: hypothetical protein R6U70_07970 [Bacillota bacterium]